MSKLTTEEKVLVAFYTEYQKDLPEMNNVSYENLDLDRKVFLTAVKKLKHKGFVDNISFLYADDDVYFYTFEDAIVSMSGINYVEDKLGIQPDLSASDKVKEVTKKVASWGYSELKDFAVKVTAELIKGFTTNS